MKKDIKVPLVTDIGIAMVREQGEDGAWAWYSYLINLRPHTIEGVIVASKGYGAAHDSRKTSMLRHYIDEMPPQTFHKIEPVLDELFGMFNEYLLTFFEEGKMYDRRYVFVPESISEQNYTDLPLMAGRGVLIL